MARRLGFLIGFIFIFVLGIFLGAYFSKSNRINESTQEHSIEYFLNNTYREMPIVGVDDKGNGVLGILTVEVKPGSGLVLVNINNVLADYYNQLSARNAAIVAANFTHKNLANLDVIYNLKANASIVEGPSAGSVMAISTIAALSGKKIKPNVYMTGAITPDGKVTAVGGIKEKANAATLAHGKLFIIPESSYVVGYKERKACTNLNNITYCEIKYVQDNIDLNKYLGIKVQQVKYIYEAVNYTLE